MEWRLCPTGLPNEPQSLFIKSTKESKQTLLRNSDHLLGKDNAGCFQTIDGIWMNQHMSWHILGLVDAGRHGNHFDCCAEPVANIVLSNNDRSPAGLNMIIS
nr:MAG TPA: hypothetical protein [Caudoviricetes sp.]